MIIFPFFDLVFEILLAMFCSVEILVKCIKLLFDVTTLGYVETLKLSYQDLLQFFTKTAEKRLRKMH